MENLIQFMMCGDSGKRSPYSAVGSVTPQKILLLINKMPSDAEVISEKLDLDAKEINDSLEALKKHGLIKETEGKYSPAFAIFTLEDLSAFEPIVKRLGLRVKEIVSQRVNEVDNLIRDLDCTKRGLEFPDLRYIIVGAMTLDYNGLRVLKSEKLLSAGRNMPGGGNYVFSGLQSGSFNLKEGWMWGNNSGFGEYLFGTHGRLSPAGFRMAFPDIAWQWAEQVEQADVEAEMEKIGRILEALSKEDLSTSELKPKVGGDNSQLLAEVTLLLALGYVAINCNKWRINRPFFFPDDLVNIKLVADLILREFAESLNTAKSEMLEVYAKTSPAANGIAFEEAFNPLYHLIFEGALSLMMKEGLITSPTPRQDAGCYSPYVAVGIRNLLDMLGLNQ
jgi:hypothetical protein